MKILVVEDREDISNLIKLYLEKESYSVEQVFDGETALERLQNNVYQLCIFDVMLPKLDGFLLLKSVRNFSTVPVVMVTAKLEEADKILGLDLGADDYIVKPFSALELVSRVNSVIRRNYHYNKNDSFEIRYKNWSVNQKECSVENKGVPCSLTTAEYKILLKLVSDPGRVFSKHQLYKAICSDEAETQENSVTVHMSRLRDKLDDKESTQYIKTIRGLGYKLEKI